MTRANVTLALKYCTEEELRHQSRSGVLLVGILITSYFSLQSSTTSSQEDQRTSYRYLVNIIGVYPSALVQSDS